MADTPNNTNTDSPATEPEVEKIPLPTPSKDIVWWIVRVASIVLVFAFWEVFGRRGNQLFMSYPSKIIEAAGHLIATGELQGALKSSLVNLITGFTLASFIGITLGLLLGRYRLVESAIDWIISAMYATPLVALIPLVILWFGLGDSAKLFIITVMALFPILINTASGVRNIPRALIDVGVAFDANERQAFTKIIIPAVVPYVMTGIRLGVGRAIIGMVVAEFYTAITGLGASITKYANQYDTASTFVPILVLMLLGITLTSLARRVEDRFAPWRQIDE